MIRAAPRALQLRLLSRRDDLRAALVLASLLVWFLREPILRYGDVSFTTADVTQAMSLTRLDAIPAVRNTLLTDPVTQFLPWMEFDARELASGRVPLWNPYNGCGVPQLANFQSAVFSPFSVAFYVLSTKLALLVTAFFKLFLTGFGTYLLFRKIDLEWLPALAGGVLFAFSGHNVLLVSYPHAAVIAWMPWALLAAENLLRGFESDLAGAPPTSRARSWAALIAFLVLSIYSGHPETLFFSGATIAAWVLVRLASLALRLRSTPGSSRALFLLAARFAGAAGVSAGLGAPQLLPFFEYLRHSATLATRAAHGPAPLDAASWPRYFYPDLLGTPVGSTAFAPAQPPPNYEAATLGYVGALALLVAVVALPRVLRDARVRWFALGGAAWVLWAHDVAGVNALATRIPFLARIPVSTSQGPWAFAVAAIAALQLHAWIARPAKREWLESAAIAFAGVASLVIFRSRADFFVNGAAAQLKPSPAALAASAEHLRFVTLTCVGGIAALAAFPVLLGRTSRLVAASVVLALAFVQTGGLLSGYNTSCEDRFVFPRPPQLQRVLDLTRDERVAILGRDCVPSGSNMAYGLDQPAVYDGLEVREYVELYSAVFRAGDGWRQPARANRAALDLFGVKWLLVRLDAGERTARNSPWAAAISGKSEQLAWRGRAAEFDVFEALDSRGREWLVGAARAAADESQSLSLATSRGFDAHACVVLGPGIPSDFEVRERGACGTGTVRVLEREPTRVALDVESSEPAYLVTTLPHYPGWRATLDGRPASLARANHAFTALDVPAGAHRVELVYDPFSWRIGLWIAAASLAALAAVAWRSARRRRR